MRRGNIRVNDLPFRKYGWAIIRYPGALSTPVDRLTGDSFSKSNPTSNIWSPSNDGAGKHLAHATDWEPGGTATSRFTDDIGDFVTHLICMQDHLLRRKWISEAM